MDALVLDVVERGMVEDDHCILHSVKKNGVYSARRRTLDQICLYFSNWRLSPGKCFKTVSGNTYFIQSVT